MAASDDDDRRRRSSSVSNGSPAAKKPKKISLITPAELLSEFSHHHPTAARINNGSFGCCPSSVLSAQRLRQLTYLSQPDAFFFNHLRPSIDSSRALVKDLINARHVSQVSLVDNATTAAAIVLRHAALSFSPGDVALSLDCAFDSVKRSFHAYVARAGGRLIQVHLPFPLSSDSQIISEFEKTLKNYKSNGHNIKLAIIDHVSSMPSVVIPLKELVRVCREGGVDRVFVDGAHAIGSVHVDVQDIGADYYVSNLHKWFFCPPSVAVLYCREEDESCDLHHPVVSHEYGNGLAIESSWVGTRDYTPQLVVPDAMEFVSRFEGGIEGIRKKNHENVVQMGEMLAKSWGTSLGSPPEMCSSMVMVGLPSCLGILSDSDASTLRTHLRNGFDVEVPLYYRAPKEGEIGPLTGYARISYQVYNRVEEYHKFRDAINELVKDGFTCADLSH